MINFRPGTIICFYSSNYSVTIEKDKPNMEIDNELFQIIIIIIFIFIHFFEPNKK